MAGLAEKKHKAAVADLGCAVCRRLGYGPTPSELHHKRGGQGGWGKGDYRTLIPLCPEHHRGSTGVHGLGTKGFVRHFGFSEADLLADTLALLSHTA